MQRENFSIIHGCDGHSYQQHYISQDIEKGYVVLYFLHVILKLDNCKTTQWLYWFRQWCHSFSISEAHRYRLQCYYCIPGTVLIFILTNCALVTWTHSLLFCWAHWRRAMVLKNPDMLICLSPSKYWDFLAYHYIVCWKRRKQDVKSITGNLNYFLISLI